MKMVKTIAFLCALGLFGAFSGVASANPCSTLHAEDVKMNDEQSVKDFVMTALDRTPERSKGRAIRELERNNPGCWKHETNYLILIDEGYVILNLYDRKAEDRELRKVDQELNELLNMVDDAKAGETVCMKYTDYEGNVGRYACAVDMGGTLGSVFSADRPGYIVGGYHPENVYSVAGSEYKPDITATQVAQNPTAENVKLFVKETIKALQSNFDVDQSVIPPGRMSRFRPVLRTEDGYWKDGDIYIFVMFENNRLVFFNGNSQELEDTLLDITDQNGCNVGDEIVRVINDEPRECKGLGLLPDEDDGFVEYLWDNPDIDGDEDPAYPGDLSVTPGTTPKLAYVELLPTSTSVGRVIVGAGVYPPKSSDGDGCAIAGPDNTSKGAVLNLFLVAFALFTMVSLKKAKT